MKSLFTPHPKTLIILALVVLLTIVAGLMEHRFLSRDSIGSVLKYAGLYGVIAIGVSFVIATGGIDLSIGSWVGLTAVLFVVLLREYRLGPAEALVVIALLSLGAGLIHGILVTRLDRQPFLITLCGLFVYRGIARVVSDGREQILPEEQEWMRDLFVHGRPLGLPVPSVFLLLLLLGFAAAVFLNLTVTGRHLLAAGRNETAARFSGIATARVRILAFMLCSLLAGVAGILFLLDSKSALGSSFGSFFELWAIAGAVLGGCSLRGGESPVAGVLLGSLLVAEVRQAVFFVAGDVWKEFVIGIVILFGIIADQIMDRWLERRRAA